MALSTPSNTSSPNQQALSNLKVERLTGVTGTVLTFTNVIDPGFYLLLKNGVAVDPATLTIVGKTITLGSASSSGDWWLLLHHFRSS